MPHRHYYRSLIALLAFNCAFFHKPTEFEKGIKFYRVGDYNRASRYFDSYSGRFPKSDSCLYFLYDCYQKLDRPDNQIRVLERLAENRVVNANVYLNLFEYYRGQGRYPEMYNLLITAASAMQDTFNRRYVLTRRRYAEIACGAAGQNQPGNPVIRALTMGLLNPFPDGNAYPDDTVTVGNLVILLDRFVPPVYPKKFYALGNIPSRSFLYLPYLRLVELGVLDFDTRLEPDRPATCTACALGLARLKARGYLR
jgi:tetratricopeptide (TPR) repeat protein